jgi:hypothetical protein
MTPRNQSVMKARPQYEAAPPSLFFHFLLFLLLRSHDCLPWFGVEPAAGLVQVAGLIALDLPSPPYRKEQ